MTSAGQHFQRWYYLAIFTVVAGGIAAIVWGTVAQMATPRLYRAVRAGDAEGVQFWAGLGGDVHFAGHDAQHRQPLHEAAVSGRFEIAEALLEHGSDVDARDAFGQTPLMFAAWAGHEGLVALLIEHGADVNAKAFDGMTPLYGAVSRGRNRCAEILLDYGANPNRATHSYSLMSVAVRRGDAGLVEAIVKAGGRADERALRSAMRRGDRQKICILLSATEEAILADLHLDQRLQEAVLARRVDIADLFLQHGASAVSCDGDGNTLLHLAAAQGDAEMIRRLLFHGAEPQATNPKGETAEDVAVSAGYLHCASMLQSDGPTPGSKRDSDSPAG